MDERKTPPTPPAQPDPPHERPLPADAARDRQVAAVKLHHGGFEQATPGQCLVIWRSLDEKTQAQYLAALDASNAQEKVKPTK